MIGLITTRCSAPKTSRGRPLGVHQPRRKVEASVTQAETQVAQMTSEDLRGVLGLRRFTADMGSALRGHARPGGQRRRPAPEPQSGDPACRGFAVGATMSIVPWAALNLLAPACGQREVRWQRVSGAQLPPARKTFSGGGQKLSEPGQPHWRGRRRRGGVGMVVICGCCRGVVVSLIAEAVVSALSDRTRVAAGRRTPWIIAGGVVSPQ